jgi:DNA-binding NarL/FixJ family response regulator
MLLEAESDTTVAEDAGTGSEALATVRRHGPDVELMDVRMPDMDGIEAATHLVRTGSRTRILMPTTFDLDEYLYLQCARERAASCSKTPAAAS